MVMQYCGQNDCSCDMTAQCALYSNCVGSSALSLWYVFVWVKTTFKQKCNYHQLIIKLLHFAAYKNEHYLTYKATIKISAFNMPITEKQNKPNL